MVDIPFLILFALVAIPLSVAAIGAYVGKRENNSVYTGLILFASAGIWITIFLATDNIIVDYSNAHSVINPPTLLSTVTQPSSDEQDLSILRASQTATNADTTLHSTVGANKFRGEKITATGSTIGLEIDTIQVKLAKGGLPTGELTVGIDNDGNDADGIDIIFGTKDISTLTTTLSNYNFTKSGADHNISTDNRILVHFNGGDSSNYLRVAVQTTDIYDGTNSVGTGSIGSGYADSSALDLTFKLFDDDTIPASSETVVYNYNGVTPTIETIPAEPIYYEFNDEVKYMFLVIAAMTSLIAATTVSTGRSSGGFKPFDKL